MLQQHAHSAFKKKKKKRKQGHWCTVWPNLILWERVGLQVFLKSFLRIVLSQSNGQNHLFTVPSNTYPGNPKTCRGSPTVCQWSVLRASRHETVMTSLIMALIGQSETWFIFSTNQHRTVFSTSQLAANVFISLQTFARHCATNMTFRTMKWNSVTYWRRRTVPEKQMPYPEWTLSLHVSGLKWLHIYS